LTRLDAVGAQVGRQPVEVAAGPASKAAGRADSEVRFAVEGDAEVGVDAKTVGVLLVVVPNHAGTVLGDSEVLVEYWQVRGHVPRLAGRIY
jgi:hypothetical protein